MRDGRIRGRASGRNREQFAAIFRELLFDEVHALRGQAIIPVGSSRITFLAVVPKRETQFALRAARELLQIVKRKSGELIIAGSLKQAQNRQTPVLLSQNTGEKFGRPELEARSSSGRDALGVILQALHGIG